MGPSIVPDIRSDQQTSRHRASGTEPTHAPGSTSWRMSTARPATSTVTSDDGAPAEVSEPAAQIPRLRLPVYLMLGLPILMPLPSAALRHWLIEAGTTACVAGGFIAAPFLTVTAWIGLALPARAFLHHLSTALFLIAILWMAAALIGAHLHENHRPTCTAAHAADEGRQHP
jgi:hypothetical protein